MSMKTITSTPPQHKSNLRNIRGTFAAEGMTISKSTRSNLDRIASGQTSYQQVLTELQKYEEKGHHLADQNIEIDLDDGVKHNYELFADVLAKIK